jgi:hypothetical protein
VIPESQERAAETFNFLFGDVFGAFQEEEQDNIDDEDFPPDIMADPPVPAQDQRINIAAGDHSNRRMTRSQAKLLLANGGKGNSSTMAGGGNGSSSSPRRPSAGKSAAVKRKQQHAAGVSKIAKTKKKAKAHNEEKEDISMSMDDAEVKAAEAPPAESPPAEAEKAEAEDAEDNENNEDAKKIKRKEKEPSLSSRFHPEKLLLGGTKPAAAVACVKALVSDACDVWATQVEVLESKEAAAVVSAACEASSSSSNAAAADASAEYPPSQTTIKLPFPDNAAMIDFIKAAQRLPVNFEAHKKDALHNQYRRSYMGAAMKFVCCLLRSKRHALSFTMQPNLFQQITVAHEVRENLKSYKQSHPPYGISVEVWTKLLLLARIAMTSGYGCVYIPSMRHVKHASVALPDALDAVETAGVMRGGEPLLGERMAQVLQLCTQSSASLKPQHREVAQFLQGEQSDGYRPFSGMWFVAGPAAAISMSTYTHLQKNTDGDDVYLFLLKLGYHCRIADIDSYEMTGNANTEEETHLCRQWAIRGRDYLHETVLKTDQPNRKLYVRVTGTAPYGDGVRLLVEPFTSGSANLTGSEPRLGKDWEKVAVNMILAGWTRADPTRSGSKAAPSWKVNLMNELEKEAVQRQAGIWEDHAPDKICMPATQRKNADTKPWLKPINDKQ